MGEVKKGTQTVCVPTSFLFILERRSVIIAPKSTAGFFLQAKEVAMKILKKIPTFAFLLVAYDILIVIGKADLLGRTLVRIKMMSGALWVMSLADLFIILGLIFLFVEVIKSTRTSQAAILDHILSTLVFIIFLIEFIVVKGAGSSVFLILCLMSLFDVIAGFTVTITTARRDITMDRNSGYIPPSS